MLVAIPFPNDLIWNGDKDKIRALGAQWNWDYQCYELIQQDLDAYIEIDRGQWYRIQYK